jgi:predicted RNA-binding Zn-ribbon protein involved in translation (DUF1610 family)
MPRQSLAEEYYLKAEETPEEPGVEWLLLHDFEGLKPSTRFWTNLKRLEGLGGRSSLIQYSVLQTDRRRVAVAAKKLAEHYGADTIRLQARVVLKEIELTHTWGKTPSMRARNLTYMAERSLGVTVPVNPVNTSQICSGCGCVVKKDLSVRTHCCPRCGLTLDRDVNAARNILRRDRAGTARINACWRGDLHPTRRVWASRLDESRSYPACRVVVHELVIDFLYILFRVFLINQLVGAGLKETTGCWTSNQWTMGPSAPILNEMKHVAKIA